MKQFERLKQRGISLRTVNAIMLLLAILVSIALFMAMTRTTRLHEETHEITRTYVSVRKSAYNLQMASDYLTEQIRCFAVTGDPQYVDNYFEEANVTKRRDNALEEMEQVLGMTQAMNDLSAAMDESLDLMNQEYYAGRLTIEAMGLELSRFPGELQDVKLSEEDQALSSEAKLKRAQELLFGEDYHHKKDRISEYTQKCLNDLMELLDEEQVEAAQMLKMQVFVEHMLTWVLIVILLGIVLMIVFQVFKPLGEAVERIREEQEIPIKGAYEVRFLAKTYNLTYQTNRHNQEKLSYDATHDKLTGLYNRRGYDSVTSNVDWDTSALIIIDMDDFKGVNDTHGHDVGDQVLKRAANAIFQSFRSQDFVCRIGGDEFAVIMVHADVALTDLIRRKFDHLNEVLKDGDENVPGVSICAGVAFGTQDFSYQEIFKAADEALYHAKTEGKKTIRFYV